MSARGKPSLATLLETAEELRRAGLLREARGVFVQAAQVADRAGDACALVTAALGSGGLWVHEEREVLAKASVQALWQRASELAEPDSLARARLEVRLAAEAVYEGGSVDAVVTAVDDVRAFHDNAATAESLSLLHHVLLGPRHAEERREMAENIIQLAMRARDELLGLMGLCWRTVDLFLLGDPRANQSLTELGERSEATGCDAIRFIAEVLQAMVHARAGRLGRAEELATTAAERGTRVGDPDAPAYFGAIIAALRWWQGRAEEVIEPIRQLVVSPRLGSNDHVYVAADALLSAVQGDYDSSEEALTRLLDIGLGDLPDSSSWLTTQFLVVECAYLLGDARAATEAAEMLRPYSTLPVMPSLAVVCLGSAERAQGLASATIGELDQAVDHLLAALRFDRWLGSRPMYTMTQHSLAATLRARSLPGDKEMAERASQQALTQARRMGMQLPNHPDWLVASRVRASSRRIHQALLERVPRGWKIGVDGRLTIVPDRVGFSYLLQLLARPGRDLEALALISHGFPHSRNSSEPILDRTALQSYQRRIRELKALPEQQRLSESATEQHRRELAELQAALRTATGLGRRSRSFPDEQERARTAVRKALVRAVASIEAVEPELGDHLRRSVMTGATCRYQEEESWLVSVRDQPLVPEST